jgi:hypothetical protein
MHLLFILATSAARRDHSAEIAPDVFMPLISGGVSSRSF